MPRRAGVATLPGGWTLLLWNGDLGRAFAPDVVMLSQHGPAVGCAIEEHVMRHEARGYADGGEAWRVVHDSGDGIFHLEATGSPPPSLRAIHDRAVAEQNAEGGEDAGVDLIAEVPPELAKAVCGFKHDDDWPASLSFVELDKAGGGGGSKPGILARLFGR